MGRSFVATLLALPTVAALACGGPAVTSRRIRGPDGHNNWVTIACPGAQASCTARASEVCPGGYDVTDSAGHVVPESNITLDGQMLVKCHGAVAAPARLQRECMGDESCDLGVKCLFAADAGITDVGHCDTSPSK